MTESGLWVEQLGATNGMTWSRADKRMRGGESPVTITQAVPAVNSECPECGALVAVNSHCVHCATTREPIMVERPTSDNSDVVRKIVKGGQLETPRLKRRFG